MRPVPDAFRPPCLPRLFALCATALLAACASVAPPAPPTAPPAPPAPSRTSPDPAVIYAPPAIDKSFTSVAQDSRVQFIVLHYTAIDWDKSLRVLTTGGQVSSHYLVRDNPAQIYQIVDENRRAWHAGNSFWAGNSFLNAASIGIEIVNPGYRDTPVGRVYAPYSQAQIDQVIALVRDLQWRHQVRPERILGHADIAPGRKQDPGPNFPWKQFADAGLIPWPDPDQVARKRLDHEITPRDMGWVQERLARIGYNVPRTGLLDEMTQGVISTFQMKYRPANIDGFIDPQTAALIDVVSTPEFMRIKRADEPVTKPYTSQF
jgi:N-acetylmuramoyl-L-alanine amidase